MRTTAATTYRPPYITSVSEHTSRRLALAMGCRSRRRNRRRRRPLAAVLSALLLVVIAGILAATIDL